MRAQVESKYLDAYDAASYLGTTYRSFDHLVRREGLRPDGYRGRARVYTTKTLDLFVVTLRNRKEQTGTVVSIARAS